MGERRGRRHRAHVTHTPAQLPRGRLGRSGCPLTRSFCRGSLGIRGVHGAPARQPHPHGAHGAHAPKAAKVKRVREIRDIRREYNQTGEPTSGRTAGLRRGCQREQSPPGGKRRGPEAGSDLAGPGDGEQGGAGGPAGCRSQTMKSALNINYASEDGAEAPLGGTRGLGTAAPPAPLSPRLPAGLRETGAGSPAGTRR